MLDALVGATGASVDAGLTDLLGADAERELLSSGLGGQSAGNFSQLLGAPGVSAGQELPEEALQNAGREATLPSAEVNAESVLRELGTDPVTNQYRVGEADTGARLQSIVGPLTREPSGSYDWFDQDDVMYDAVGPAPAEFFDAESFTSSIESHLNKQGLDKVVINISNLGADQQLEVEAYLNQLAPADRLRVIVLK